MIETVISGSSGFIGSNLSKRLPDAKCLKHWDIRYGHQYIGDKMFFLSTYGNMAHHKANDVMVKANVQDLITVLNGFSGWLCYMSSSSVTLPVQTPYSRTKRAAEEILQALPELKSCIVRPYSVTGVGEQKEHLIPTLIRSCMEGEHMEFAPNPVHDFIDVEDVVDGLIKLSKKGATGIFEFGTGMPYSNDDVLELVEEECGKKANVTRVKSLRSYDNDDWFSDKPNGYFIATKTLSDSISEMVEAYREV